MGSIRPYPRCKPSGRQLPFFGTAGGRRVSRVSFPVGSLYVCTGKADWAGEALLRNTVTRTHTWRSLLLKTGQEIP